MVVLWCVRVVATMGSGATKKVERYLSVDGFSLLARSSAESTATQNTTLVSYLVFRLIESYRICIIYIVYIKHGVFINIRRSS